MHRFQTRITRLIAASVVATSALAAPAMADFVGVSRCSASSGASVPAIHFVSGGQRFIMAVGENGLTRNIIMNERRALAWAAASGLFPEGTAFGNYRNYICGMAHEDVETAPPVEETVIDTLLDTETTTCTECDQQ